MCSRWDQKSAEIWAAQAKNDIDGACITGLDPVHDAQRLKPSPGGGLGCLMAGANMAAISRAAASSASFFFLRSAALATMPCAFAASWAPFDTCWTYLPAHARAFSRRAHVKPQGCADYS